MCYFQVASADATRRWLFGESFIVTSSFASLFVLINGHENQMCAIHLKGNQPLGFCRLSILHASTNNFSLSLSVCRRKHIRNTRTLWRHQTLCNAHTLTHFACAHSADGEKNHRMLFLLFSLVSVHSFSTNESCSIEQIESRHDSAGLLTFK